MIVYRLERDGIGPYQSQHKYTQELCDDHCDSEIWPSGFDDFNGDFDLCENQDFKFAFDCLATLEDWFDDWLEKLLDIGFEIKEYIATEYYYGRSGIQLVFKGKPCQTL